MSDGSGAPPLLLLDVDGVLNALSDDGDRGVWSFWRFGLARAEGRRWPILWAPAVVDRLRRWHEDGVVELQWLSTWGHAANLELRNLLGLPELPVAGTYDEADAGAGSPEPAAAVAHAAVAPSAPDPLSGRWWKFDVVRRLREAHPGRLLVWVDDELHRDTAFRRWAADQPDVLPLGPDPTTGLSPADLDHVAHVIGVAAT